MNGTDREVVTSIFGLIILIVAVYSVYLALGSVPEISVLAFALKSFLLGLAIGYLVDQGESDSVSVGFFVGFSIMGVGATTFVIILMGSTFPLGFSSFMVFLLGLVFMYSRAPHRMTDPELFIVVIGIISILVFIIVLNLPAIIAFSGIRKLTPLCSTGSWDWS